MIRQYIGTYRRLGRHQTTRYIRVVVQFRQNSELRGTGLDFGLDIVTCRESIECPAVEHDVTASDGPDDLSDRPAVSV